MLTKTRNDLNRPETAYNDQETTWNDLQRPTTSKKRPETTYNEQERIWNDLHQEETTWNDLKRPTTSKKRAETTYSEQKTTWNDPQRVRHNLQWPEHTYNEQRKDVKRPTARRFSDYFTKWGKRFSSLTRFPPNIWLQLFEFCLVVKTEECFMVKTERPASIIILQASIIMCIFWGI